MTKQGWVILGEGKGSRSLWPSLREPVTQTALHGKWEGYLQALHPSPESHGPQGQPRQDPAIPAKS